MLHKEITIAREESGSHLLTLLSYPIFRYSFPASFNGRSVEDVRLRFKDGVVVEARAARGQNYLDAMLQRKERQAERKQGNPWRSHMLRA